MRNSEKHDNRGNNDFSANRNYKDTVFRMLYQDKRELLALYNAENGSEYADPDALEVYTLESAIYMGMKNDVSFIVDTRLVLYEHQASVNENMPLRDLFYVVKQYEQLTTGEDIYGKTRIKLPAPKFITFYNGKEKQPQRREMKLSEAYYTKEEDPSLELKVIQLNINPGYNEGLKKKCPTLYQYMQYVEKVRYYGKSLPLRQAVERAVDECIGEGILRDFLLHEKAQVVSMSIFEFDQELHDRTMFRDGKLEGRQEGRQEGRELTLITQVCRKLRKNKRPEEIADELEEDYELIRSICDAAEKFAPEYEAQKIYEKLHPDADFII